jgi:hypothetical protein
MRIAVVALIVLATAAPALSQETTETTRTTETTDTSPSTAQQLESFFRRWEISLGAQIGAPKGFVKVGEFDRSGDKLRLHNDLNIDTFEVVSLGAGFHITERDVIRARVDYTFLYGTATRGDETAFNGALLAAGESIRTRPVFGRITGLYEHEFIREPSGALLAAGGGLTFVYLNFKLHGTLAPATVGHETQEDFYAQELPVWLLAVHGEYPISDRVHLIGAVDGGCLPWVDSLRTEGGTVKIAQGHADVFAGVRVAITPQVFADAGYTYTYFSQHEHSHEDDNKILFLGHAFGFGLTYRF